MLLFCPQIYGRLGMIAVQRAAFIPVVTRICYWLRYANSQSWAFRLLEIVAKFVDRKSMIINTLKLRYLVPRIVLPSVCLIYVIWLRRKVTILEMILPNALLLQ